jgi:uncharacterized protein YodC (DUF2158 family)
MASLYPSESLIEIFGGAFMELKPGDVVTLKSGGQLLTVAEVHEDTVACLWMGNEGDLFRETLPLAVLERAEELDDDEDEGTRKNWKTMKRTMRKTTSRSIARRPEAA